MQVVLATIPFALIALVVWLVLAPRLRARAIGPRPPARKPRSTKLTLHVSPDRMDDDLQDLLRRS